MNRKSPRVQHDSSRIPLTDIPSQETFHRSWKTFLLSLSLSLSLPSHPRWSLLRDSPLTALLEGNKYRGRDIAVTAKRKARPFYYTASKHKRTPYSTFYPGHVERDGETLAIHRVSRFTYPKIEFRIDFNFDDSIILFFKFIYYACIYLIKFS